MAEKKKLSRRMSALLWLVGAAIVIGILIALHQIAVIYLIATVALVVLLLIVAYSDLESIDRQDILGSEMD